MFKSIIPGLVTLDTDIKRVGGSDFFQYINFFENVEKKGRFHYKLSINNEISIPSVYDFRSDYFFKINGFWYYNKKLFGLNFKFKYDTLSKTFQCNKLLTMIPFRIGGLLPMAEYLQSIVVLDLFLEGFINTRGCAFHCYGKNYCVIAPGFNGKTSYLTDIIRKGGKYIAENNLFIDLCSMEVYPTANAKMAKIFNRKTNRTLEDYLSLENIVTSRQKIDKIFLVQNSTSNRYSTKEKNLVDFLILNSFYFLHSNLFIKSYMFEEGLTNKFLKRFTDINNIKEYEFTHIKNFNFNNLFI